MYSGIIFVMLPFFLAFSKQPQVISYKGALKSKKTAKPAIKKCWLVTAIIRNIKQGKIDETETTLSVIASPKGKYYFILLVTSFKQLQYCCTEQKFSGQLYFMLKRLYLYTSTEDSLIILREHYQNATQVQAGINSST